MQFPEIKGHVTLPDGFDVELPHSRGRCELWPGEFGQRVEVKVVDGFAKRQKRVYEESTERPLDDGYTVRPTCVRRHVEAEWGARKALLRREGYPPCQPLKGMALTEVAS